MLVSWTLLILIVLPLFCKISLTSESDVQRFYTVQCVDFLSFVFLSNLNRHSKSHPRFESATNSALNMALPTTLMDGLRQRNIPVQAPSTTEARQIVFDLNTKGNQDSKDDSRSKTYGRTPSGMSKQFETAYLTSGIFPIAVPINFCAQYLLYHRHEIWCHNFCLHQSLRMCQTSS